MKVRKKENQRDNRKKRVKVDVERKGEGLFPLSLSISPLFFSSLGAKFVNEVSLEKVRRHQTTHLAPASLSSFSFSITRASSSHRTTRQMLIYASVDFV